MGNKMKSLLLGYGLGLASFVVTFGIALLLRRFQVRVDLSLLAMAALFVASWYGGRGPGFLVAVLLIAATVGLARTPLTPGQLVGFVVNESIILGILVLLVSNKRKTETKLKEQGEWLRITLSSIGDAVIATDLDGKITFINPTAQALTGWGITAAAGMPVGEVFRVLSASAQSGEPGWLSKTINEGEVVNDPDAVLFCRDEVALPIEFNTSPIRNHLGKVNGAVLVFRDVTERNLAKDRINKLNEELEQRVIERTAELNVANEQLESFSYSVSHDLRAPLRAMDGFSRILLEDFQSELSEQSRRFLQIIRDNANQMGRLIDDLLSFSRISRKLPKKRLVAIGDVVEEALRAVDGERLGREVEVNIGPLPQCEVDPALVQQVFVNLLTNALKYSRKKQPAIIEVGCRDLENRNDGPVFFVKDNGVGFDMNYAHKLFEVFQRLHKQEEYEGTGVGLAIVQRIIQRHGGTIWAEAEVDKGATFYFTLGAKAVEPADAEKAAVA
jgi:PAS domain S-box-containing protein